MVPPLVVQVSTIALAWGRDDRRDAGEPPQLFDQAEAVTGCQASSGA